MDLLRKRDEQRKLRREGLRQQARARLRNALHHLAPGEQVLIFGSLTQPGKFHESSDIDIAFVEEPRASRYGLQSQIEEIVLRPVDLVVLPECRFRAKIEREGELWTS